MKYLLILATILSLTLPKVSTVSAAVKYKNCTELNKKYKGGVAIPGARNKGGKTKFKPHYSKSLYLANASKDRDKDKIACER